MLTQWGEQIKRSAILPAYPRPQMARTAWENLNGEWQATFTDSPEEPDTFDLTILVPFSPETRLSGIGRTLKPGEYLWYRRMFDISAAEKDERTLLHFGAVDRDADVWINGALAGGHAGGYLPFTLDVTELICVGQNVLTVRVTDDTDASYHSRGKQKTDRGGIWYTPQSGIWQTVWLERVPSDDIQSLRITPRYDDAAVELTVYAKKELPYNVKIWRMNIPRSITHEPINNCENTNNTERIGDDAALDKFDPMSELEIPQDEESFLWRAHGIANGTLRIPIPGFAPWTPEQPQLYGIVVEMGEDRVTSYFGMRKFSVGQDAQGRPRLMLNNAPCFHSGVLDQGYWPDGLYTAPSDEAMESDILLMKRMGFNMLRKHIKVEPMRWYYHCDRLGMLVWQDMVNGGGQYGKFAVTAPLVLGNSHSDRDYRYFRRENAEGRGEYRRELAEMIEQLYNCVSVCMWVPFNEGWGQFDAAEIAAYVRSLDDTRTIDHASGWHDQGAGDVKSLHVYFKPYRFRRDTRGRPVALTEFGGYGWRVEGHCFSERTFGYKMYGSEAELTDAFVRLYEREILPARERGLSAAVYTQLSDVEEETNGLVTYDRKIVKMPVSAVRAVNARLTMREDI